MINQVDNVNWLKSLKADISSVSLRKSDWRSMGCLWVYMQKMELRYRWEYGDEKTRIN